MSLEYGFCGDKIPELQSNKFLVVNFQENYAMKHLFYSLLFISAFSFAQQEQLNIELETLSIAGAPGIQSYSYGQTSNGRWVIFGGRLDGLHQRQPFAAFLEQDNNKSVYVIDPIAEQVWSSDLNVLSTSLYEQLQSTNQQFSQVGNTLYITGGYGFSSTANDHLTYPYLTAIKLDSVENAVINQTDITPFFRQIVDVNLKVTGGQMEYLDGTFYLVGGHLFDGAYNPMGPDHGPGFTQIYTNDIRTFTITDDGTNLSVGNFQAVHDTVNLHRRDYNMVPQIFPDGSKGFTAFSGVFDYNDMPYLNSVDITSPTGYVTNNVFNQYLSQYHSAKLPVFDSTANKMHTVFFGGLSQFTMDANQNLIEDIEVPFVKTISKVTRNEDGSMQEVNLGYIEMPSLVGSGAEFIKVNQWYTENGVLRLNDLPNAKTLVGYIYGGIESTAPNIFFINDGTQSIASNVIFKVYINKSVLNTNQEIPVTDKNVLNLTLFPNPVNDQLKLEFFAVGKHNMAIRVLSMDGKIVQSLEHSVQNIGKQEISLDVRELSKGTYLLEIDNGVIKSQEKFIKK